MLLIAGTVRIAPEKLSGARAAMQAMVTASRSEDGCGGYAYAEDMFEPGLIHISETWRDRAAIEAHAKSAHMAVWRAAGREIGISDRDLTLYETANPQRI